MKFGKYYKQALTRLPESATSVCIPYDQWKKWIRVDHGSISQQWQDLLTQECGQVDKFIFTQPRLRDMLCLSNAARISVEDKLYLCELNARALYKICKKLQKKIQVPALKWYLDITSAHAYRFTGSSDRTLLAIKTSHMTLECPICFEDRIQSHWILMRCGR
jgi:hypothetical protein